MLRVGGKYGVFIDKMRNNYERRVRMKHFEELMRKLRSVEEKEVGD